MFDFDLSGMDGGPSWSDGPGCFWHALWISLAVLLAIGLLKWWG